MTSSRHGSIRRTSLAALAGVVMLMAWATPRVIPEISAWMVDAPAVQLPAGLTQRLQAGDLVFRIGQSWQSGVVRGVERDAHSAGDPYSHVGMLVGNPTHWQVVHAVPAELPTRSDAVVLDDLDFFLAPEQARGAAIYRVAADPSTRAAAVDHALARLGMPFNIAANDTEGQYCTTLIWYAWQHAGMTLGAQFDDLNLPLMAGRYLLPHSLRTAPELQLLFETPQPH
jgi:cell wall-associated NlpC family hydrolase